MKVGFWCGENDREEELALAFVRGASRRGVDGRVIYRADGLLDRDYDVACVFGVKSFDLFRAHTSRGIPVVYFDKGYIRRSSSTYWRMSVNAHSPVDWVASARMPTDRADRQQYRVRRWCGGKSIVIAGASEKYHRFYGLPHPTEYARQLIKRIRELSEAPIVYRPKPSWRNATPIPGSDYSDSGQIGEVLRDAAVLVTHGSNACLDAILDGVPSIVLGNGITKSVSSAKIEDVACPHKASFSSITQMLANVAYCQWTTEEIGAGDLWDVLMPQLESL